MITKVESKLEIFILGDLVTVVTKKTSWRLTML